MRRITQLVALIVALLVAGQSALAESTCSQWLHSGCKQVPACCISASDSSGSQLSMDCHESIHSESIGAECNQSGCHMATVRVVAPAIVTVKSKDHETVALVVVTQFPVISALGQTTRLFENVSAPGPARYLLFQVFRI